MASKSKSKVLILKSTRRKQSPPWLSSLSKRPKNHHTKAPATSPSSET